MLGCPSLVAAVAVRVEESVRVLAWRTGFSGGEGVVVHRFPDCGEPLLPFVWGLRFLVGLEQQCPGLGVALTRGYVKHDTYENAVIPAVRSWLSACRCNVPAPELRSYLFYMFAPRPATGFVTIELDKKAAAIALPANTPWRDAAPKLKAGKVWLVAK